MMRVSHANANAIKDNFRGTGSKSNVRFLDQNRKKWNTWESYEWFKLSFILKFSKLPVFDIFSLFQNGVKPKIEATTTRLSLFLGLSSEAFSPSIDGLLATEGPELNPEFRHSLPFLSNTPFEKVRMNGQRWKKLCEVKEEGHFPDDFFSNPPKSPLFQFPCVHLYVWPRLLFLTRNSTGDLRFKEDLCLHFSKVLCGEESYGLCVCPLRLGSLSSAKVLGHMRFWKIDCRGGGKFANFLSRPTFPWAPVNNNADAREIGLTGERRRSLWLGKKMKLP